MPALPLFAELPSVCARCDRLLGAGEASCPGCHTPAWALQEPDRRPEPIGLGEDDAPATSVAWPVPAPASPSVQPSQLRAAVPTVAAPAPRSYPPGGPRPTVPMATVPPAAPAAVPAQSPALPTSPRRAPVSVQRPPIGASPTGQVTARPGGAAAAATPASRYALTLLGGPARGKRLIVSETEVYLGSSQVKGDPSLSHQHAGFVVRAGRLYVHDHHSHSGVYVSIRGQEALPVGAWFSVGQRCFHFLGRLEAPAGRPGAPVVFGAPVPAAEPLFALEEMLVGGRPGRALASASNTLSIGTGERTDLCYPGDEGLAVIHCEFSPGVQSGLLRDLSGGLGTFVRLAPNVERRLYPGDRVRVGTQLLRVDQLAETAQQPPSTRAP